MDLSGRGRNWLLSVNWQQKYDVIVMEDLAYFCMDFRRDLGHPFEPPYPPTVAHYTDNYILMLSSSKIFSYADSVWHGMYQRQTVRPPVPCLGRTV